MAATKTKSKHEQELEALVAEMKTRMDLLTQLQLAQKSNHGGKPVVGIKNISNYTIGLVNKIPGEEGTISLHPEYPGTINPNARATISLQFWQQLRKGKQVQKGMIMRDDSHLAGENVAPPDGPEDLPAEFAVNAVVDPFAWVDSKDDAELREAVSKITSEPTLRRLYAAVDYKIWEIGEAKYKDDEKRAKKAIADTPMKYTYLEKLVLDRLDEFRPNYKNYANESKTVARF